MALSCAADPDLGFTRDRRPYARKSGEPDLRGPPQSVAVLDQRCHSASLRDVNARLRRAMDARDRAYGSTSLRAASHPGHTSVGRVRSLIHFSNSPSRSRGAFLRPGFATLLHSPRVEGWAERRETFGCVRGTRGTRHNAACQALARRLASHDAGRSPLGAPPWRF